MTDSTSTKYRTLRAIEGEGEDQRTEDFEVWSASGATAFVLDQSRVPECFGGTWTDEWQWWGTNLWR